MSDTTDERSGTEATPTTGEDKDMPGPSVPPGQSEGGVPSDSGNVADVPGVPQSAEAGSEQTPPAGEGPEPEEPTSKEPA